jgi:preprotein translocase subunit Sec63
MSPLALWILSGDLLALCFVAAFVGVFLKRVVCKWWSECLNGIAEDMD